MSFRSPKHNFVRRLLRFHVLLLSNHKKSVFLVHSYTFSSTVLIAAEMHINAGQLSSPGLVWAIYVEEHIQTGPLKSPALQGSPV